MVELHLSKLAINWPALLDDKGEERDLNNSKVLPSHQVPAKQLMPAVPVCIKEMKRYWDKPFQHRVLVKGYSGLEIASSEELGLADPPVVEYHLHLNRRSTIPQMEHLTASMYQKVYKSAAQSVKNLNVVTLLTDYKAELLQEMGHLLDKVPPVRRLSSQTSSSVCLECSAGLWPRHGLGHCGGEIAVA